MARSLQVRMLHVKLRALDMPSHYARVIDGVILHCGESLLIHLVVFFTRCGRVQVFLLDLTPQGRLPQGTGSVPETGLLRFHGLQRTLEKIHEVEDAFLIGPEARRSRWSVNVGDGAVEGPYGIGVGAACARALAMESDVGWGSLDGFHAADGSGAATDATSNVRAGFIGQYMRVLTALRGKFAFGTGRIIMRAIARRYDLRMLKPRAPHSESTRKVMYESGRCTPVLFLNLPCYAKCLLFLEKEAVVNARQARDRAAARRGLKASDSTRVGWRTKGAKQARKLGREMLDPAMLIFIKGRFEHRAACLLKYGTIAQNMGSTSGFEQQLVQSRIASECSQRSAAARALHGVVRIYAFLGNVVHFRELSAFTRTLAWMVAGKLFPQTTRLMLSVLLGRTLCGMPVGLSKHDSHPFAEPTELKERRLAHQSTKLEQGRRDSIAVCARATAELAAWAKDEQRNFATHVEFWETRRVDKASDKRADVEEERSFEGFKPSYKSKVSCGLRQWKRSSN
jgi:hypothetical protein